jgi:hypothetical protein
MEQKSFVMWWVPIGHQPTMDEALQRLDMLRERGASEDAFDWAYLKNMQAERPDVSEDMT